MNKIELGLTGNEPLLTIKIDGLDYLSIEEINNDDYYQVSVPEFLLNEYMWTDSTDYNVYNGTMLIGICSCDCQGCDDLLVEISTKDEACTVFESYGDTIRIYYYDGWKPEGDGYARSTNDWNIKFDGKTLENALAELAKFSAENLVINPDEVPLRPEPFKLLYTKDKSMLEIKQGE